MIPLWKLIEIAQPLKKIKKRKRVKDFMKKIISLFLLVCIVFSLAVAIYATSEEAPETTLTLTKIEGLSNTLGVQKLDIRLGGYDGWKHIQETGFDDVYWEGSQELEYDDLSYFKIPINITTSINYWKTKAFSIENGITECIWEYKNYCGKKIKIRFTFLAETETTTPDTTTETAGTTTDLMTSTPETTNSTAVTETPGLTENILPEPTPTSIPSNQDEFPNTGESIPLIFTIIGVCCILAVLVYTIYMYRKSKKSY